MDTLTYVIASIVNLLCFLIGAKVGQKVVRQETILKSPMKSFKEHKQEKEIDKEEEYFKTLSQNIDSYNGSSIGQKKIGG